MNMLVGVVNSSGIAGSSYLTSSVAFKTLKLGLNLGIKTRKNSILMSNQLDAAAAAVAASTSEQNPPPSPWLIVGLGNPGFMFKGTRHNVGFDIVDALADAEGISMSSGSFKYVFGKGYIGDVPVMLAKPQTFMNASGESVGAIVSYHNIPLKQVLLVYDDLDLPFAKMRLLPKGGHGGHNGMKSVIKHLDGSRDFPRLRIGIGRPSGRIEAINYVLRAFSKQEREELELTLQKALEAIRILLLQGFDKSATFVNTNTAKPKPKQVENLG